jgi:hypothetical protein
VKKERKGVGRETKSRTDEVLFLDEEDEINIPYI